MSNSIVSYNFVFLSPSIRSKPFQYEKYDMDRGEKYAERRFWRYCTSSIHKTRLTGASTRSRTLFGQRAEIDQKAIFAGASLWSSAVEMWFANRLSSLSCWIFTVEYRCDISAPSDPSVAFSAETCNLRHCAPRCTLACWRLGHRRHTHRC